MRGPVHASLAGASPTGSRPGGCARSDRRSSRTCRPRRVVEMPRARACPAGLVSEPEHTTLLEMLALCEQNWCTAGRPAAEAECGAARPPEYGGAGAPQHAPQAQVLPLQPPYNPARSLVSHAPRRSKPCNALSRQDCWHCFRAAACVDDRCHLCWAHAIGLTLPACASRSLLRDKCADAEAENSQLQRQVIAARGDVAVRLDPAPDTRDQWNPRLTRS